MFLNDLSRYKQQFNTFNKFEISSCILLISKRPFMLCFSKNANGKKLILLRVPLVKMFIVIFYCLCDYVVCVVLHTNEAINR